MLKWPHCRKSLDAHDIAGRLDLVGTKEAAEALGVKTSRLQDWRSRPDFPEPAVTVGQGALWIRSEVLEWARQRQSNELKKLALSMRERMQEMSDEERA